MKLGRPRLVPVEVPWMVSPSGGIVELRTFEAEPTQIVVVVSWGPLSDTQDNSRCDHVRLTFDAGWVRKTPIQGQSPVMFEGAFDCADVPLVNISSQPESALEAFQQRWRESGTCPDPRVYRVEGSRWVSEAGALKGRCIHFLVLGQDAYAEVLSNAWAWERVTVDH